MFARPDPRRRLYCSAIEALACAMVLFVSVGSSPTAGLPPTAGGATAVQVASHSRDGGEYSPGVTRCNGSEELCQRRVDQVTFAGAHNAMSSAADGWLWPSQAEGIRAQLEAGIRAFLLDAHYWETPGEATVMLGRVPEQMRGWFVRRMLEWHPGEVFLCHGLCAAGSVSLVDALREFGAFLEEHPGEVLFLNFEDHVRAGDMTRAFRESGLLEEVYVHPFDTPWPTLGELVAARQRVIVQAEHSGRRSAWYGPLYEEAWDTPYDVSSEAEFSCRPARGRPSNTLLLLNHWVARGAPKPEDAAAVNSRESLLRHAQQCVDEYGKTPNILAVDFATVGDLVSTVAALNAGSGHGEALARAAGETR